MTDITELAQREKFEAWWERTQHNGNPPRFGWECWRDGEGYKVDDDDSELEGMWEAWKAAGAEMVEALEKAQHTTTEMENRIRKQNRHVCELFDDNTALRQRIAELEESHAQVIQSRDHYKRMSEEGLKQLVESRTVTVKLPPRVDSSNVPFAAHTWNCCLTEVEKRLTGAGIKWEAE